jgi:hypothetical protein
MHAEHGQGHFLDIGVLAQLIEQHP